MNEAQRASAVFAEAIFAFGQISAMQADNRLRISRNEHPIYTGEDFNHAVQNLEAGNVNHFLVGNKSHL